MPVPWERFGVNYTYYSNPTDDWKPLYKPYSLESVNFHGGFENLLGYRLQVLISPELTVDLPGNDLHTASGPHVEVEFYDFHFCQPLLACGLFFFEPQKKWAKKTTIQEFDK